MGCAGSVKNAITVEPANQSHTSAVSATVRVPGVALSALSYDWDNYIQRNLSIEQELKELYAQTQRRAPAAMATAVKYVRPFLSSTFRDFNAERDLLHQKYFPQLDKLCNQRGVFFAPLDLRWGVTTEQANCGQVIKICLEEIDRSVPYFVASLGFRNGWAFNDTDYARGTPAAKLLDTTFSVGSQYYPWIANFEDRSVTELEILHGLLNNPDRMNRTYIYFRSVACLQRVPVKDRQIFAEMGWAEHKLSSLKRRIIESGFSVTWFDSPTEMAEKFWKDLSSEIEQDFPLAAAPSNLKKEISAHKAVVEQRTRVYVGGEKYLEQIDNYVAAGGYPLAVVGHSGAGKSSLMANWAKQFSQKVEQASAQGDKLKDVILIQRHIGATQGSTCMCGLISDIVGQINDALNRNASVPVSDAECLEAFGQCLEEACVNQTHRVVIVIDALDQMEMDDRDVLGWLPHLDDIPPRCRIIVSTLVGTPSYEELVRRKYQQLEVTPLSETSACELIQKYMNLYGKSFDSDQRSMILKARGTRNPLYLTTFLQEIRGFGRFEQLPEQIKSYMKSDQVEDMFIKVLDNLESEFVDAPLLVPFVVSLIEVSHNGLTECELQNALRHVWKTEKTLSEQEFPMLPFSGLLIRLEDSIVKRGALNTWSHKYFSSAVRKKYISTNVLFTYNCHFILMSYFATQSDHPCARTVEELPFHCFRMLQILQTNVDQAQAMMEICPMDEMQLTNHLKDYISDISVFDLFSNSTHGLLELHRYWSFVQSRLDVNVADLYAEKLESQAQALASEDLMEILIGVGSFLVEFGRFRNAGNFFEQAFAIISTMPNFGNERLANVKLKHAKLHQLTGGYKEATQILREAECLVKGANRGDLNADIHSSIAYCLKGLGRVSESLVEYEHALKENKAFYGDKHASVAVSLCNMAELYIRIDQAGQARIRLGQATTIFEKRGKKSPKMATCMALMAACELKLGNRDGALAMFLEAKALKEELLGVGDISVMVIQNNIASIYADEGNYDKAIALLEEVYETRKKAHGDNIKMMASTLLNMGVAYNSAKQHEKAAQLFERVSKYYETKESVKQAEDVMICYGGYVHALIGLNELETALQVANVYFRQVFLEHLKIKPIFFVVADACSKIGKINEELKIHREAIFWRKKAVNFLSSVTDTAELGLVLMQTAIQYSLLGKDRIAIGYMQQAYRVRLGLFGKDHPLTVDAKTWVTELEEEEDDDSETEVDDIDATVDSKMETEVRMRRQTTNLGPLRD